MQFAEPIEKSKVIFFDRRPEAKNRPPTTKTLFPNTIFGGGKKNSNTIKSASLKKYNTYRNKNKNKTNVDFTRTNRKPPIEAKQTKIKTIMFPNDEKENYEYANKEAGSIYEIEVGFGNKESYSYIDVWLEDIY